MYTLRSMPVSLRPNAHVPGSIEYLLLPYFCSVDKSHPSLFNTVNYSTPGFPVLHYLLEFTQSDVQQVDDAIQPSHPLASPSPLALNLSRHQGFSNESALHIR